MNQPAAAPSHAADLEQYLALMDELNNSLMHPNRRALLETCAEAMQIVLEMTRPGNQRGGKSFYDVFYDIFYKVKQDYPKNYYTNYDLNDVIQDATFFYNEFYNLHKCSHEYII